MSKTNINLNGARPVARTEGMLIEELDGDMIVYDSERNQAHALNRLAAQIWKQCDGERTASDLARLFAAETPADAVTNCLSQLERLHLLNAGSLASEDSRRLSRRQLLREASIAGAAVVLLPMVTSIVAPSAEASSSCAGSNVDCRTKFCCPPLECSPETGKCFSPG
jgi:hypothetical protein